MSNTKHLMLMNKCLVAAALGWMLVPFGCRQNKAAYPVAESPSLSLEGTSWVSEGNRTFADVGGGDSLPVVYDFTWKFVDDTTLITTIDVTQVLDGYSHTQSVSEQLSYTVDGTAGTVTLHIPDGKTLQLMDYPQHFDINWPDSTITVDYRALPNLYPGIASLTFVISTTNNRQSPQP